MKNKGLKEQVEQENLEHYQNLTQEEFDAMLESFREEVYEEDERWISYEEWLTITKFMK